MRSSAACACLLALLTGCGTKEAPSDRFRAALLSPGPISDAGWNAGAYEGLKKIERELGAEINQVETKTPAEFEEGFRHYASRHYDIVFGHGFEFQQAAATVAPQFPSTTFITTSGTTLDRNLAPMVFELEQATYLLGIIAASLSKTGKAGCVGGIEIPSVQSTFLAFEAGARSVQPDFQVTRSFIGSWEDVSAARQATLALADNGADFIFHNCDAAAQGVFAALRERNVTGFGSNRDQNGEAPEHILASAVLDIPAAFLAMAREVKERRFESRIHRLGLKDGIVSLSINPRLAARIPPELQAKLRDTEDAIRAGKLEVPRGF